MAVNKISDDTMDLVIQLYNHGFSHNEIHYQTSYSVSSINNIKSKASGRGIYVSPENLSRRLEVGINSFMLELCKKPLYKYVNADSYDDPWMVAFAKVKMPVVIGNACRSIEVEDIMSRESPEESLLYKIYNIPTDRIKMGEMALSRYMRDITQPIGYDGLVRYIRTTVIKNIRSAVSIPVSLDKQTLKDSIKSLSEREQEILHRRHWKKEPYSKIKDVFGVSEERIRGIESAAAHKLRQILPREIKTYSFPYELARYARGLESTVEQLKIELEKRDAIIRNYSEKYESAQNAESSIPLYESEKLELLRMNVSDCKISERTMNRLMGGGITKMWHLVQKSESSLLGSNGGIKGFGEKCLYEVKELLASMGLSLGTELTNKIIEKLNEI